MPDAVNGLRARAPRFPLRRFLVANAIMMLDEVVYLAILPLLPHYRELLDLTPAETGLLYAVYPLLALVTALPAGALADRVGARRMLVVAGSLFVLATAGFAFADTRATLWSARALEGISAGLAATTGMAALADGAPSRRPGSMLGAAAAVQALAALLGPVLGGFVAPALGTRVAFLIPAALMLPLLSVLLAEPDDRPPPVPPRAHRRRPRLPSLRVDVRVAALAFLGIGVLGSSVQTLTPLSLAEAGVGTTAIGTAFLVAAAISLAIVPLVGRAADRRGVTTMTSAWLAVAVGLTLGLALADTHWTILVLFVAFLPQIRIGGLLGYVRGARGGRLGSGLGSGYGAMITAWSLGATLGPPLAGAVAQAAGYAPAYAIVAAVGAACAWPATRRRLLGPIPA